MSHLFTSVLNEMQLQHCYLSATDESLDMLFRIAKHCSAAYSWLHVHLSTAPFLWVEQYLASRQGDKLPPTPSALHKSYGKDGEVLPFDKSAIIQPSGSAAQSKSIIGNLWSALKFPYSAVPSTPGGSDSDISSSAAEDTLTPIVGFNTHKKRYLAFSLLVKHACNFKPSATPLPPVKTPVNSSMFMKRDSLVSQGVALPDEALVTYDSDEDPGDYVSEAITVIFVSKKTIGAGVHSKQTTHVTEWSGVISDYSAGDDIHDIVFDNGERKSYHLPDKRWKFMS